MNYFFAIFSFMLVCLGCTHAYVKSLNDTLVFPIKRPYPSFDTVPTLNQLNGVISEPIMILDYPGRDGAFVILSRLGKVWYLDSMDASPSLFMDIADRVLVDGESGFLSLAFHPDFENSPELYVFYNSYPSPRDSDGLSDIISCFSVRNDPSPVVLTETEEYLIFQHNRSASHIGGHLLFGNDGYLYISFGDEGREYDFYENSQRIDRDFFSSILRIDVDENEENLLPKSSNAVIGNYRIPRDNPFIGVTHFNGEAVDQESIRTEIWALGFRNPWRMYLDEQTDLLYASDVGQITWEEINLIEKGGNYGWVFYEANENTSGRTPPVDFDYIEPLYFYGRDLGGSNLVGLVYRGDFLPSIDEELVFADFNTGLLFSLNLNDPNAHANQIAEVPFPVYFWQPRGSDELVVVSLFGDDLFHKLVPNRTVPSFEEDELPQRLSFTGAFKNLDTLEPESGIHPYSVKVPFWSDGAEKSRWFALTEDGVFGHSPVLGYETPIGSVFIKHFDLEIQEGNPASNKRIETRFIIRHPEGIYGLSYEWNDAETEAFLVPSVGSKRSLSRIDENGTPFIQDWIYPSRANCQSCHNEKANFVLGFSSPQLNSAHETLNQNQIDLLIESGYLEVAETVSSHTEPVLVDPWTSEASLENRVRSYLHANCVSCHFPDGNGFGYWDARITTPTREAVIVNGTLFNNMGDESNRSLVMNDAEHSMLLKRISSNESRRMPPIGSSVLDEAAISLLTSWIESGEYENFFPYAEDLGGYKWSSSFGFFNDYSLPWVLNFSLGWAYVTGTTDNIWAYSINHGWIYTGNSIYPFIYDSDENRWLFISEAVDTVGFYYDLNSEEWYYAQP